MPRRSQSQHGGLLRSWPGRWIRVLLGATLGSAVSLPAAEREGSADIAPVELPAFQVRGDLLEDFGFRVSPLLDGDRSLLLLPTFVPVVDLVLPNTAASKAGIRPGDRVVSADGRPTGSPTRALRRWQDMQKRKWKELSTATGDVIWRLDLEPIWSGTARTVELRLPTPAPRWGATIWRAPVDRVPVTLSETGPLARRAEEILNNGIWMILRESYVRGFQIPLDAQNPMFLGYQWTLWDERGGHRMFVSRQRDRTDIVLEAIERANNARDGAGVTGRSPDETLAAATTTLASRAKVYLTSPDGELIRAIELGRSEAIPADAAQAGFLAEMDFWLKRVGKTSPLWPLGVLEPAPRSPTDPAVARGP